MVQSSSLPLTCHLKCIQHGEHFWHLPFSQHRRGSEHCLPSPWTFRSWQPEPHRSLVMHAQCLGLRLPSCQLHLPQPACLGLLQHYAVSISHCFAWLPTWRGLAAKGEPSVLQSWYIYRSWVVTGQLVLQQHQSAIACSLEDISSKYEFHFCGAQAWSPACMCPEPQSCKHLH